MYVITFYSFKGGVGRTMALVNVAAELARRGRSVLAVDFDLEAPGLETYKHLSPPKPHPGIVEYVTAFRRTQQVPNLLDYIYETKPIGKKGGQLWVMPAGRRDRAYRTALANLDWTRLYQDEEGFLLFEDTKMGWAEELKPDYVLIDSRTGDTDVLGICTRQLPDSVVLMFTPNEQNLAGLENVCRDIRLEETEGLKKKIKLHFVAANVPDLDDEKGILRRQLKAFKKRLDFEDLSGVIWRCENLNLLDQSVFTLNRRHSRLARSYRRLLRTLLKDNLADRDGAMFVIKDYAAPAKTLSYVSGEYERIVASRSKVLHKIALQYSTDVEVLNKVADLFGNLDPRSTIQVLDRALELQPDSDESLVDRARCKINVGDIDGTAKDLLACLTLPLPHDGSSYKSFCLAKLNDIAPSMLLVLADVLETPRLQGMDLTQLGIDLTQLAYLLCNTDEGRFRAARLMRRYVAGLDPHEIVSTSQLLRLLRARCWNEVIQLHESGRIEAKHMFELAVAHWGKSGEMPEPICRQALESEVEETSDEKKWQATAVLLWRIGNIPEAVKCLEQADKIARTDRAEWDEFFSLWRLGFVSSGQFLDDCQLFRRMVQGEPLRPAFLGLLRSPGGVKAGEPTHQTSY